MKLLPAAAFGSTQLAATFTAGYEGYYVPVNVDERAFEFMVGAWDIDLTRSRVAVDAGTPVGLCMLGVRGARGWIGGLAVVPARRRDGVGRSLLEEVLAGAPPVVTLEVLEQNEPAIALYERLGFTHRRLLEVWSLKADVPDAVVRSVEPAPLRQADVPWQRDDRSLPAGYGRLETDGGAALVFVNGERVSLLQLAADDEKSATTLVAAARALGSSLHYMNVPEGDPASAALRALGGSLDLRQFELELAQRSMPLSVA